MVEQGPLAIKAIENKDWREERRRRLQGSQAAKAATSGQAKGAVERTVQDTGFGLQLTTRRPVPVQVADTPAVTEQNEPPPVENTDTPEVEMTLEERAIQELTIGK